MSVSLWICSPVPASDQAGQQVQGQPPWKKLSGMYKELIENALRAFLCFLPDV